MSTLKLFGISFDKIIGIIGNVHTISIVSLVLSIAFDFLQFGTSRKIVLDISSLLVVAHFFGFFFYQIFHLLTGRILLNWCSLDNYKILALIEFIQAYSTILYFFNPFITMHRSRIYRLFEIFEYTSITEKYSFYIFVGTSFMTSFVLLCSSADSVKKEAVTTNSKKVFGMSYKTCESLIHWLSFFSLIPSMGALLVDVIFIINFPYINRPSNSQMIAGGYYTFMFIYQYGRFLTLLFPYLEGVNKKSAISEVIQLVLCFAFLWNPYRVTNKTIFEYFHYTTYIQSFAIPILFISLFFNSCIYCSLSFFKTPQKSMEYQSSDEEEEEDEESFERSDEEESEDEDEEEIEEMMDPNGKTKFN